MTTKIWITRPQPDAERSAGAWKAAGFETVIAPLLTVTPISSKPVIPDAAELIFTSANGARYSNLKGDDRQVYAVGEATAKAVQALGFVNIVTGGGNWKALLEVIENNGKSIIHISGSRVRGKLLEALRAKGYDASRLEVYQTYPVQDWPLIVRDVDAVTLYSPFTAQTLMELPKQDLSHLSAYCLSENVATPLKDSGMRVHIAPSPNEMSLIACSQMPDR